MARNPEPLPPPDKSIPLTVVFIGTFEIGVALLGFITLFLYGQMDGRGIALLVLLVIYATMGAGLWAIQEWARFANVVLHTIAVPYLLFSAVVLANQSLEMAGLRLVISAAIVIALSRPAMRHKFQTVVPKQRKTARRD
ncbi:MAG: hypothetical protein ACE5H9_18050 [Anaerolineae bacterium]